MIENEKKLKKKQKGFVVYNTSSRYQPNPDEVLITTAPRDVYSNVSKIWRAV